MNFSFWAHIFSLIGFLGVGYWGLRLYRQKVMLSELLGYPPRIKVDWPLSFLRNLAESLSIEMHIVGTTRAGNPAKIDVKIVSEFFRQNLVTCISAQVKNDIINVTFEVLEKPTYGEAQALQEAFQNSIVVNTEQKR